MSRAAERARILLAAACLLAAARPAIAQQADGTQSLSVQPQSAPDSLRTRIPAKKRKYLEAGAGMGLSTIRAANSEARYEPRILPHAGISLIVPVEGGFALRTGLLYEQRGWQARSSATDTDQVRTDISSRITLHALSIPLMIRYTFPAGANLQYSVAAGMSYSFFVHARDQLTIDSFRGSRLLGSSTLDYNPYVALIPDTDSLEASPGGTGYFTFNQAARLELSVTFKRRYTIQLFGAHGLGELSTSTKSSASLRTVYCGLTFLFSPARREK